MAALILTLCVWLSTSRTATPLLPAKPALDRVDAAHGNGLQADYYNGTNFEEKVYSRIEKQINFWWLGDSPAPGVHTEDFSTRWTGHLFAPATGVYRFVVRADDGVRVWVGNTLILEEWHLQQETFYSRNVLLQANQFYRLKVEYYNHLLHAVMQLYWEVPPKTDSLSPNPPTRVLIPEKYLYPPREFRKPANPVVAMKITRTLVNPPPKQVPLARKTPPSLPVNKPSKPIDSASHPITGAVFEDLKPGKAIVLKNVLFEQSQYVLLKESYEEVNKLLLTLQQHPLLRIEIRGHTDNMGDPRLNQALSENRAQVVANFLIRHGIDESRVEAKGYGSTQPVADNTVETERARNRRVEFVVK